MNSTIKGIISSFVILLLVFATACGSSSSSKTNDTSPSIDDATLLVNYVDGVVEDYNQYATDKLAFFEDFTPSDNSSRHYRTEFRLTAYRNAIGKSYLLNGRFVDLVASKSYSGNIHFRIYTTDVSFNQVIELIRYMSPIIDNTISTSTLNATINEISTKKHANGYYYGELGLTLFGTDETGYDLMIKND